MTRFLVLTGRTWVRWVVALAASSAVVVVLAAIPSPAAAAGGPGSWTPAQINAAIANGVAYIDAQQNTDGSYGADHDVPETAIALVAYSVLADGNFSSLPASYQTHVENAITYLLSQQNTTHSGPPDYYGSWSFETPGSGDETYSTGLALLGLSFYTSLNSAIPTAIANGRAFLTGPDFEGPTNTGCSSADSSSTAVYCGGWNYEADYGRSDESNSGYAMTGLEVTGGIPASIVPDNINWNYHVQEISSNPFAKRNDGGADYQPGGNGFCPSDDVSGFCSNANDSGTNLFSFADDGVPISDPHVAASIAFDQDVLNSYELMKANVGPSGMAMIAHSGATEDGSCTPNATGCDWTTSGDGGFHYSLFALTKGLGSYISPNASDPNNWYAKVVDLLLSQQNSDGSWPPDLRDDFSTTFATGLAVAALGRVAALKSITATGQAVSATEGAPFSGTVATFSDTNSSATPSDYSATIDWGDGTTTTGTITGTPSQFSVSGSHTYAEEGSYTVTVTITQNSNSSNTATTTSTATVADAPLHATGVSPARSGKSVGGTVATFTDSDPNGTVSDYKASINWGDGTTTAGTVTAHSGAFAVSGSHTYGKAGKYTVTVVIKDAGGSTATATTSVTIPVQRVAAIKISAKLSSFPAGCVSKAFTTRVQGTGIKTVRFTLDGRLLRTSTARRGSRYSARISVAPGKHTLVVKVVFTRASHAGARTFHRTVVGCPLPAFTG